MKVKLASPTAIWCAESTVEPESAGEQRCQREDADLGEGLEADGRAEAEDRCQRDRQRLVCRRHGRRSAGARSTGGDGLEGDHKEREKDD